MLCWVLRTVAVLLQAEVAAAAGQLTVVALQAAWGVVSGAAWVGDASKAPLLLLSSWGS
jgi:hypothetical protein